jgi:ParB/RepB/Spo0J family partition protein
MLIKISPSWVDLNPYRSRISRDPEKFAALCQSIAERGILQPPVGRRNPEDPSRIQLAFGEGRLNAWLAVHESDPIEIDVQDLTDRQMFDYAIDENKDRDDLSPIENARTMAVYQKTFRLPQRDLAKRFNLRTQGAVANILSLLRLPDGVQELVHIGKLPQRYARVLLPFSRIAPEAVLAAARDIARADDEQKKWIAKRRVDGLYEKCARRVEYWKIAWPRKPIAVDPKQFAGAPARLTACQGCEYLVQHDGNPYCLRPACYRAKLAVWIDAEVKRVSAKLKIRILAKNEKAECIFVGEWRQRDLAKAALKSRHPSLRLAGLDPGKSSFYLKETMGSGSVILYTTDKRSLLQSLRRKNQQIGRPEPKPRPNPGKRNAREAKRMIDAAAPIVARVIPLHLLELFKGFALWGMANSVKVWNKSSSAERQVLVMRALLGRAIGTNEYTAPAPATTRKRLMGYARSAKIKLPARWDQAAVKKKGPGSSRRRQGRQ